eukprot:359500-Chlamydomonas_euryale.AAC.3
MSGGRLLAIAPAMDFPSSQRQSEATATAAAAAAGRGTTREAHAYSVSQALSVAFHGQSDHAGWLNTKQLGGVLLVWASAVARRRQSRSRCEGSKAISRPQARTVRRGSMHAQADTNESLAGEEPRPNGQAGLYAQFPRPFANLRGYSLFPSGPPLGSYGLACTRSALWQAATPGVARVSNASLAPYDPRRRIRGHARRRDDGESLNSWQGGSCAHGGGHNGSDSRTAHTARPA